MERRKMLNSLAGLSLTAALAAVGSGRAFGVGAQNPAERLNVAELQDHWRDLLAKDADITLSTAPLEKSAAEWRQQLGSARFNVLREEGTEYPFSSPLNDEKRPGVFVCAGCGLPLFTSAMKFDSGTGWPSFFTSIPGHLAQKTDHKLIAKRTNITACDAAATRGMCSTTARAQPASAGATMALRSALFRPPARPDAR